MSCGFGVDPEIKTNTVMFFCVHYNYSYPNTLRSSMCSHTMCDLYFDTILYTI